MNDVTFEALTRRASLLILGAAGAAALASPIAVDAKNKTKKKARKKCKKQVAPCITILTETNCGGGDPDCIAQIQQCCQLVGTCDFTGFAACLAAEP
jgi:hypothetical protein